MDIRDAHAARGYDRGKHQVFMHGEAGEDTALFGTEADAGAANNVRTGVDQLRAVEGVAALALGEQAHDGFETRWSCPPRCARAA